MTVTFKGKPMTLEGKQLEAGDTVPEFRVFDTELQAVKSNDLSGIKVFAAVPSLDTGVCDAEIRRLNERARELPGVGLFAVSLDLPFAQARWCGAAGVNGIRTLSDYYDRSFARATGTLIAELGLLTRAVFIVNGSGRVTYAEYVPEVADHPNYEKLYQALATR